MIVYLFKLFSDKIIDRWLFWVYSTVIHNNDSVDIKFSAHDAFLE